MPLVTYDSVKSSYVCVHRRQNEFNAVSSLFILLVGVVNAWLLLYWWLTCKQKTPHVTITLDKRRWRWCRCLSRRKSLGFPQRLLSSCFFLASFKNANHIWSLTIRQKWIEAYNKDHIQIKGPDGFKVLIFCRHFLDPSASVRGGVNLLFLEVVYLKANYAGGPELL